MNNRCTTPSAPRRLTTEGEKPFSPPFTRSKAPFPQAFPEKKTGSYAPKHQDHSIKQGDFLHAFHSLYTSPSQTLSIRKKKSFLLLEKWLIIMSREWKKRFRRKTVGEARWRAGPCAALRDAPRKRVPTMARPRREQDTFCTKNRISGEKSAFRFAFAERLSIFAL